MDKSCPIPEPFSAKTGAVFFIAALFFLNFMARFVFAPLMPFVEDDLHISHAQAGSLFLFISSGFAVAQFSSGLVSSRLTHRSTLILSALIVGIVLVLLGFVRSLSGIRLALVVLGLAAGFHIPSALATITAMVRRQDWGKAMGVHSSAPTLGLVLGPLLVAALMGFVSWRTLIVLLGAFSFFAGMAFLVFGKCGDFPGDAPRPAALNQIIRLPSFWIMILLFMMAIGGSVGIFTVMPLYLMAERGMDRTLANTVLGFAQVSGFLAALAGGWFADRVGPKRAMAILLVAGGAANILLGVSSGMWLLIVLFIQPALTGPFFPGAFSALSRIVPPNLRSVVASVAIPVAFLTGAGVFPTLYGYLGQTHSFGLGFVLAGSLMLLGPLFAFALKFIEHDQEGC
ncbi:MAG: transporter [Deltaproteobacteria bacterium]|nr:transporter [Deltaproteobacteria bacterium]